MAAGQCEKCGTHRSHLHRHRILPGSKGGLYVEGNIELICANCHEDQHNSPFGQAERAAKRRAEREAIIPKERMYKLYVEDGLTMRQIAKLLNTALSNVQLWITEYEIPKHPMGTKLLRPPKDELMAALKKYGTQKAVAAEYGVSRPAVSLWCKYYGLVLTPWTINI